MITKLDILSIAYYLLGEMAHATAVCSHACGRHTAAESNTKERRRLHIF